MRAVADARLSARRAPIRVLCTVAAWLAACAVLSDAARVCAQDGDEIHSLEDIVVTGTKTPYRADEAPVPTQVIRREEIMATSSDNIADVLDQIPGLYVRRNEEFRLGASTVRMQGADPNKVAILLNGRRFRGGVDGVVDLRDIPAANIERIEIIRGPVSSLYGSDAMGGVINIITRQGSADPSFDAAVGGGNFGRVLGRASHGYREGPFSYFLSYQHDEIELAQQFTDVSEQYAGDAADAKQTRDDFLAQIAYDVTPKHKLSFISNYAPVREGPLSQRDNVTLGGAWDATLTDMTSANADVNWYYFDRSNTLGGFEENVQFREWDAGLRGLHTLLNGIRGEQHQLSVGYRFNHEQLASAGRRVGNAGNAVELPGVDGNAYQLSPYFQDEIVLGERWSAVLGASVDVHNRFGAEVNPRGTISWRPHDHYRLAVTVGRGYRAPDLLQLYDRDFNNIGSGSNTYVILGNPDLEPETDVATTVTGEAQPIPGLRATVDLYRHEFRNLIGVSIVCFGGTCTRPGFENPFPGVVNQVFRYENVRKAITQGMELSLRVEPLLWLLSEPSNHDVRVDLGYGYLYSRNEGGIATEDGNQLPLRPTHRVLPGVTYRRRGWGSELHWFGEYESDTYTDLANNEDLIARNHWLFNFHVEQRLSPLLLLVPSTASVERAVRGLSVFADGYNVFDQEFGLATPRGQFAGHATFLAGVAFEW